ncbi:3'(2'),5'-bisphosphate nucleotidase CysQ [Salinarimonas rosea]|uniref:3'(2'),5'-bisphosphate nucleotidase CysQ n=1 Tax=Salinarimonas rosea TaxID=552063 RepID=UPI0003F950CE|nr:3'(2'),5'-bisphosphate nucleotidase CysQ [Salinarimonas rosea]
MPLSRQTRADLASSLEEAAREAGDIARGYFREGEKTTARVWNKAGGSPVTEADVSVDAFLKVRLSQLLPEAGWLSEETRDDPARLDSRLVWIVDPIDGTRAFLNGIADWSVAIALLVDGVPTLGVVHAPAREGFYEAQAGAGARLNGTPIATGGRETLAGANVAGPKPMVDALARRSGPFGAVTKVPSLALRIARVASGEHDLALVTANARDWDLAAADLVLAEAGGTLSDPAGAAPVYNRPEPVHGVLVAASRALHPRLVEAMTSDDTDTRRPAAAG